jgi:hypothetical protein
MLTHENVKSDHIGIYVKLLSCITDSKREDEDPKWNIHKCDLGLWKQTTKDQFSNVQGPTFRERPFNLKGGVWLFSKKIF